MSQQPQLLQKFQVNKLQETDKPRTLAFFQLEMQGGIFQLAWSWAVTGRGGECMTGTGGDPGPRGTCSTQRA